MGPATIEAIKAFQKANGLKSDGVIGKKTRAILVRYLSGTNDDWVK
jgi:murein L,D-transpeptidase YcbB/YkuD